MRTLCGDLLHGIGAAHADDGIASEHSAEEGIEQRWIIENLCDDLVYPPD
jgi:hypothetical protein